MTSASEQTRTKPGHSEACSRKASQDNVTSAEREVGVKRRCECGAVVRMANRTERLGRMERMERLGRTKDAEIERLRTAMVHAMDDCEVAADHKGNPVSTKSVLLQVSARLRAALEKK